MQLLERKELKYIFVASVAFLIILFWYWAYKIGQTMGGIYPPPPPLPSEHTPPESLLFSAYSQDFANKLYLELKKWGNNEGLADIIDDVLLMQPQLQEEIAKAWHAKYAPPELHEAIANEYCWGTGLDCKLRNSVSAIFKEYATIAPHNDNWYSALIA